MNKSYTHPTECFWTVWLVFSNLWDFSLHEKHVSDPNEFTIGQSHNTGLRTKLCIYYEYIPYSIYVFKLKTLFYWIILTRDLGKNYWKKLWDCSILFVTQSKIVIRKSFTFELMLNWRYKHSDKVFSKETLIIKLFGWSKLLMNRTQHFYTYIVLLKIR